MAIPTNLLIFTVDLMMTEPTQPESLPVLYYDGACPVCSREIAMYRSQKGAGKVAWIDVSQCQPSDLGDGLTQQAALSALHLRLSDGSLVSGAKAFTGLWKLLPRWAWLGHVLGTRLGIWMLDWSYQQFLRIRKLWRSP